MISVIIPVYNVKQYIDDCIDSVVNQTYKEIEIVLVDDGSTDGSDARCDEWARKDQRIKVFHKSNGGLMSAWKYGVEKSTGDYIGFVDADDWIDPDMYETLLKYMEAERGELVMCGLVKEFAGDRPSQKETIFLKKTIYDRAGIVNEIYPAAICTGQTGSRGISPNRVTKLYKRQLIVDTMQDCPDEVSIGEDLVSTTSAITRCNRLCIVHDFYPYHYRINNASMIQSYSDTKYQKIRALNKALVNISEKNNGVFADQIANDYISLMCGVIDQAIQLSGYSYHKLKKTIKQDVTSNVFQNNLRKLNPANLKFKEKLYLFFIRLHLWGGIILVRKIYRRV